MNQILLPIIIPLAAAALVLLTSDRARYLKELMAIAASGAALAVSVLIAGQALYGASPEFSSAWAGYGISFSLKADNLSSFLLLGTAFFSFLVAIYSFSFDRKGNAKWFYFNLLVTQAFSAGAALADNLVALLFFWEGLLVFLYVFIALSGSGQASRNTARKAFLISAVTDLCLLAGVCITGYVAGTFNMSAIAADKLTL
ncbi:MAG TPA: proton-conducting transporter membrane subunit, partial [Elusimicrobiales bacterium]|nr:proton-conducting transporter membrane subunit [Elusimicrobiales bacterium]